MKYSPRFCLFPTTQQRKLLEENVDIVRQLYNDRLKRFKEIPENAGTLTQRVRMARDELPELKQWWDDLNDVYSTVLQTATMRIRDNKRSLQELQKNGYDAGELRWKPPREFRSFTYNIRGFELDKNNGPSGRGVLTLKRVAGENIDVPIRLHRDLPDGEVKQLTVKKEPTGAWYASFTVETDDPEKPSIEDITPDDCIGIDLGVLSFIHDSDGRSVSCLDLTEDRERLEREQRSLSRKQRGSNNWEKQRRQVAQVHDRMSNKKHDFKHKLAHFYTTEYDAVFLEDLNVKGMLEEDGNARNKHEVGWRDMISVFEHHGEKNGCYVELVDPAGTTKECAHCGSETRKPVWVRTHDCPTCGVEMDRDLNAACNVLERGLKQLGVVHSEATPVETATAVSTDGCGFSASNQVDASRVVEAGSPCLKEAASAAE
ncbi:IS200/IS605 family element transposase accessory protein TnpB [Natronolimnobius sp. AArcel1]|uniref:RNA-guided endonuclease InsQ/TnpB family protein n=1 Tax=Natronolimnobius sp. AArcel1 TaxID=1679093 RepID=UPI0013ECA0E6|nr:RNA-guided endonuclease TnpB family protein [Natronolimnobius sp. AArcel1]NGM68458.1 IS200/IS605 family element transposase accessory protein TnpB [Natronolimnobius sp. AArcel1]